MPCRGVEQRVARARHASLVCKRLRKRLNQEAELNRMHATNRLFPLGSLKQKKLQYLSGGWPSKFIGKGRIFTVALCKHVCMELRNNFELDGVVPKEEAVRLRSLLQVARKRKLQQPKAMSMNPMDTMDTLPMEDCCHFSHFLNVSNPCHNITLHDP